MMAEAGTILVIDDDGVSRAMLQDLLQKQGHTVVPANDGASGLQAAAERPYDLILVDIVMPGMDGYEVVSALKADPALREVPVVMISSVSHMAGIVRAVRLGAEDFIFKPFDETLLRVRIEGCLERRRLRREREGQAGRRG
jgi:PleD family two-component response regulator